jgi:two-component system, LytTR family, response regulator
MRVLVVDDETPARRRLRRLLDGIEDVELVGEAGSGADAIAALDELDPDVVFVDVEMPAVDGFRVADAALARGALTIFVTAHDEHAVRAFETEALDYLLKPVQERRLRMALARARERSSSQRTAPKRPLLRLLVGDGARMIPLTVDRIERIVAERNYVRLFSDAGEHLCRSTLEALADALDPDHFVRVNRSTIVRTDAIRELVPWSHGDHRVVLASGAVVTWSRLYRPRTLGRRDD